MPEDLTFAKPDRYKISSYRTYNFKAPGWYDRRLALRVFGVDLWDRAVVRELGSGIQSLGILDVGCATGRLLATLADAGAERLCGLDLAPRILESAARKAAERGTRVELKSADAEDDIPWPDGAFDVVTLTGVLHHFFRPKDALLEIRRVLRERGRLIVVEPRFFPPVRQLVNLYLGVFLHEGDCRFYSPSGVARMIEALGWRDVRVGPVGWSAFMVCGSKA